MRLWFKYCMQTSLIILLKLYSFKSVLEEPPPSYVKKCHFTEKNTLYMKARLSQESWEELTKTTYTDSALNLVLLENLIRY